MNASPKFTNELINERSPYLLQHAHNPVNWSAWSEDLFKKAIQLDKPILLSIGYAACHWCHVMERESFEDETVAAYMNDHFINIKLDREERPDIDQIYMDALQAMTGSGGWPLNIFLLPNGKPFYGGTYFPPIAMHQRASWKDVLKGVKEAFENNRDKLIEQAEQLTNHIIQTNITKSIDPNLAASDALVTEEDLAIITQRILQQADVQWGGFGNAPKFPQTFVHQTLLRSYHANKQDAALVHTIRSMDKMVQGGIYDHLGGGFARYSTDAQWQAPHFEKMLYDNALILTLMAEAFQLTHKKEYQFVIEETVNFIDRELSNNKGAFYAALDADSEGVEGKFYTWSYEEIKAIVDPEILEAFCKHYQITEAGNWEHTNIIWTTNGIEKGFDPLFIKAKQKLFEQRASRIRPALDHKIILSWNNLMIIGLCKCFAALGNRQYKKMAMDAMDWIEKNMLNQTAHYFYHSNTNAENKSFAFLEDYASLIQAYIQLNRITGDSAYLYKAKQWTEYVQLHFVDEQSLFFYFTSDYQKDIIIRKKDNYDGAQASGNAMMCANLYYLGTLFDNSNWKSQADQMIRSMRKFILQYPSSFGYWAQTFFTMKAGLSELVGIGPNVLENLDIVNSRFLPDYLILFLNKIDPNLPLSIGKQSIDNQYFICKNETCSAPLNSIEHILAII
jgi:uncharacterized protein YyaL (SSP411 family)